ncbi:MAG: type IV toxin-antitoxin system AbiEi family antitoxin domain-containing protein [Nocardioides sp.]
MESWLDRLARLPADAAFTTADARSVGLHERALHRLTATGVLRRPIEGAYVVTRVPDSIDLRCTMLGLVMPQDCFVCDRTAAWLHAGDRALAPDEHLGVPRISCFRPSEGGRLRNSLTTSGEREIRSSDLMEINDVVVTTPLRTALDLGRLQPTRDLRLHGMDTMLGLDRFTHEELLAEVPRFNRRRGVVALRSLAPLADGGSASFAETALRGRWLDAGLPRPQTQLPVMVDGVVRYFLDMGLEELGLAAEYDGVAWHTSPDQQARDVARRSYLMDIEQWIIEVFLREHVFGHAQDADRRLRAAYNAALERHGRPRHFF